MFMLISSYTNITIAYTCIKFNSIWYYRIIIKQLFHFSVVREQYNSWKEECKKIVPIIGTEKFAMSPLVAEDGEPVENNGIVDPTSDSESDKKVSQWKLSLHQIGGLNTQKKVVTI